VKPRVRSDCTKAGSVFAEGGAIENSNMALAF